MNIIQNLDKHFKNEPICILNIENSNEISILSDFRFKVFHKIINSFIFLFTDDVNNTLNVSAISTIINSDSTLKEEAIILLYSEIIKRIRASYILANKGYIFEATSILRSIFELNMSINSIQNKIITLKDFLSGDLTEEEKKLTDKEKQKIFQKHIEKTDSKVNNFAIKDIPENIKETYRIFKQNMHNSTHKSKANLAINMKNILGKGILNNVFIPDLDITYYTLYLNHSCILILMMLKSLIKESFVIDINTEKIKLLISTIQGVYERDLENEYNKNLVEFVKIKY